MSSRPSIAVIGLGYVGLPLAAALADQEPVTGFDIDRDRIAELRAGRDRTGELDPDLLEGIDLRLTADAADLAGHAYYLVAVPTPVDEAKRPDLRHLLDACALLGPHLARGTIVVFESTVYPGCTEEVCGPALEAASGLRAGIDFHLGYSPERINPGDRTHGIGEVTKVVAAATPAIAEQLADLYRRVAPDVYVARDIRTAEAAKAIENAQRDINIAFVNEVALICQRLGLSVYDVLDAARTKWNFLDFKPGLVGGHCVGVDPYYLAAKAQAVGYEPHIILAGRTINDTMPAFVAERVAGLMGGRGRALVLGLTFKENVPDLRNSKAVDVVRALEGQGITVTVADPIAPSEVAERDGIALLRNLGDAGSDFDAVVLLVAHDAYSALSADRIAGLLAPDGLVADLKGAWRALDLPVGVRRWSL